MEFYNFNSKIILEQCIINRICYQIDGLDCCWSLGIMLEMYCDLFKQNKPWGYLARSLIFPILFRQF